MQTTQNDREEAISELERELNVRKNCYDRWVKEGRLSKVDARDRLRRLELAVQILKQDLEAHQTDSPSDPTPAEPF